MYFFLCFDLKNSLLKSGQAFEIHPVYICISLPPCIYTHSRKLAVKPDAQATTQN
jgi:hypothetical protein